MHCACKSYFKNLYIPTIIKIKNKVGNVDKRDSVPAF